MITNSFCFLERVKDEFRIWQQGVKDWQNFLKVKKIVGISERKKLFYDRKIQEALVALDKDDLVYFKSKLPQVEMWRLYDKYREECCFLDIEADAYGKITVVGISDFYNTRFFVRGVNLCKRELLRELFKYKIVITFNGGAFDLPKLRKELDVVFSGVHIDLKPLCVNLGLAGGLKEVERQLGVIRPSHCKGNPIDLWRAFHASGDKEYLDLLLEYNGEDCENLKLVMDYAYKKLSDKLYKQIYST
jgi:uncharacterized protein